MKNRSFDIPDNHAIEIGSLFGRYLTILEDYYYLHYTRGKDDEDRQNMVEQKEEMERVKDELFTKYGISVIK